MRANARSKSIIAFSLILLLAIFLFSLALSVDFAAADSLKFLSAEVTTSTGEFIPAGFVFDNSAVDVSFIVYQKEGEQAAWEKTNEFNSNFSLLFRNNATQEESYSAPSAVGSYTVSVIAKDSTLASEYYFTDWDLITKDKVIGSASFRIYYQNLYLYNPVLDESGANGNQLVGTGELLLPGEGHDFYNELIYADELHTEKANKLYLGGTPVDASKYAVEIQMFTAGAWSVPTSNVDQVGRYRLKVTIDSSVDLSCVQADGLEESAGNHVFYREFSVICETLSLSLADFPKYGNADRNVELNSASKTLLAGSPISSHYMTELLFYPYSDNVARVIAPDGGNANLYHPTEVGSYVYRVIFNDSIATYGISNGDYVDVEFEILPVPYRVLYYYDNTEITDVTINYEGTEPFELTPIFYDLSGTELDSVTDGVGHYKYDVTYQKYIGETWQDAAEHSTPGLYKLVITFTSDAMVGSYKIPSEIGHVFRLVRGDLEVGTTGKTYVLPLSGTISAPAFTFTYSMGDASEMVGSDYSVIYYPKGSEVGSATAPTAVGEYVYDLTVNKNIPSIGVTMGATYRGEYAIAYRSIKVDIGETVVFRDKVDTETILLDSANESDIEIAYYKKSGNIYKQQAKPSAAEQGQFVEIITVRKNLDNYCVANGNFYSYLFSNASTSASITIDTSFNETYDGGVKVPTVTFDLGDEPIALTPLVDYQVAYYYLDGEDYLPCDAPILAGNYRVVVTILKNDNDRGLLCGSFKRASFPISPMQYGVTFTVSEESKDLVYDNRDKTYDVSFTYKSRPITVGSSVQYATATGAFGSSKFKTVGSYRARVVLDDDKSGSVTLDGGIINFAIEPLSLKVIFTVRLGYNRMWIDDSTNVEPAVHYLCENGRFKGQSKTATELGASEYLIAIGENKTYKCSENNGMDYDIDREPRTPGYYKVAISLTNTNVVLSSVQSRGDNDGVVQDPTLTDGVASQRFMVTPREVLVKYTYDAAKDSLYYTNDDPSSERTLDRKGVASVAFMAYTSIEEETGSVIYNTPVSFTGDYKIYYMISDSVGTTPPGIIQSLEKPYDKSFYVARVTVDPDGSNDEYLSKYTFKNGKNADGLLGESPLTAGCYVDDVFRIKDQNKLDVVFNMPDTFANDGNLKKISAVFYNNFAEVPFEEGDDKDYKITYLDEHDSENTASYSAVGTYRFRITFKKDNVAYRLENYSGDYSGAEQLYIKEGDTLTYEFSIFDRREIKVDFVQPDSLYYDNESKVYSARFSVEEDNVDCTVTLTEGTHYRVRYYKKNGSEFSLLTEAPKVPGDYGVEVVFLKDLLDYTYNDKTVLTENFYSLAETASGEKVATPRVEFTMQKAVLSISGVYANDKSFDGTNEAFFDESKRTLSIKKVDGKPLGVNVDNVKVSDLTGQLSGTFGSIFPGENVEVSLSDDGKYAFAQAEYNNFYVLDYPSFSANIVKATINVRLKDATSTHGGSTTLYTREYNPFAIESTIAFHLEYDEDLLKTIFPDMDLAELTVGELSYEKGGSNGNSVGRYPIVLNTLCLNDGASGAVYSEHAISELFKLDLESECYYEIVPRAITVAVVSGQHKVYGDDDPTDFTVEISQGRLIYGDRLSYAVARRSGENAGVSYLIELSNVKVLGVSDEDVSANYTITIKNASFRIDKRELLIIPKAQTATYNAGFSYEDYVIIRDLSDPGSLDANTTKKYLTEPPLGGDRLTGKLSYEPTDNVLQFRITQGTMVSVVNALGKNVTSNYLLTFDSEVRYYTITRVNVDVKLKDNAVLQKYYGDKEPIIDYTIDDDVYKKTLGKLTLATNSSVGREAGETVGNYYLKSDNSERSFLVYDDGIDVTDYFTFTVKREVDSILRVVSEDVFTILPRPVIATVEDETYQYTGREIVPVLKYLNANGSRLSATLREDLESKINISVPTVEYTDGDNLVTPVIEGEIDPNYDIKLQAGHINVVYLQNVLTVTPLDSSDEFYSGREFLLSGIMLYKTVRFYKIETANGEQPTRELDISLPIDKEVAGDGLVVVAIRQDGSSKAFSFAQSGQTIVYQDNGAYYVAIAEVQEWFYVIWGVTIIIGLVLIYLLIRLIIFIVKRYRKKAAQRPAKPKKKKKKNADQGTFNPSQNGTANAVGQTNSGNESDSLFSDTAVVDNSSAPEEAPIDAPAASNASDDMFTDVAPTEGSAPAPINAGVAPSTGAPAATDDLLSDIPVVGVPAATAAPSAPVTPVAPETSATLEAPAESSAPAAEPEPDPKEKKRREKERKEAEKKAKKEQEKREKEEKKKKNKKEDDNKPKGFMPSSFKPKGDKSAAYAPTRSFTEDLFDEDVASLDIGVSPLSDTPVSDDSIVVPPSAPSSSSGDDELIVSRGGGFADDPDEEKKKKDGDPV